MRIRGGESLNGYDPVERPSHYCEGRKYMPVDVAEDWGLDKDAYLFNVFTYICRAGRKGDTLEDLKKARFYLNRRIMALEKDAAPISSMLSPSGPSLPYEVDSGGE